jgi:hypothetical protein
MMVTGVRGYDLDYAGRAVGQAYRCALGTISRPRRQGAAGHLVRPRRRTAGLAKSQQVGWEPYNLLFGSGRGLVGRSSAGLRRALGRPWRSTGRRMGASWRPYWTR